MQAVNAFAAVDDAAISTRETLCELIETLEAAAAASGLVTSLVQNLTHAVSMVSFQPIRRFYFTHRAPGLTS